MNWRKVFESDPFKPRGLRFFRSWLTPKDVYTSKERTGVFRMMIRDEFRKFPVTIEMAEPMLLLAQDVYESLCRLEELAGSEELPEDVREKISFYIKVMKWEAESEFLKLALFVIEQKGGG